MPSGAPGADGFNYRQMSLGVDVDFANGVRSGNSTQPIQIHTFQGTPQARSGANINNTNNNMM